MAVETYLELITSEHNDKPKFMATVEISIGVYNRIQEVLSTMVPAFDLDDSVGSQLDDIGKWVGVSRNINTPLSGIYFTWGGAASVGWSSGIWQGAFSPTSGITSLPDDVYRTLIRAKIAANRWPGTIPSAYDIWAEVFPNSIIIIQDNQDMSMIIGVVGTPLDILTQSLLTGGYIPLKPEGVRIAYYAVPVDSNPIFAWGTEGDGVAGWGEGSWAQLLSPT